MLLPCLSVALLVAPSYALKVSRLDPNVDIPTTTTTTTTTPAPTTTSYVPTVDRTALLELNKKFRNQYNQRKNQQIAANLTTSSMAVDIWTKKQAAKTYSLENSYLGYKQLYQLYQNLTKELNCSLGCDSTTCRKPTACIGSFQEGRQLLIVLETAKDNGLRYEKMTVREIEPLKFAVKTLTGKTIYVEEIGPLGTISDLKSQLQEKEGFPPSQQRLIYSAHQLEDDWTFAERYIDNSSTVQLVIR